MNKSKFLKKSLAMLLAMMMVVAMIPLGASAADAGLITNFTVNNNAATINGTTITATATSTSVKFGAVTKPDVKLVYKDKDSKTITFAEGHAGEVDLADVATKDGNVYTLTLEAQVAVAESDAPETTTYTIKVTVEAASTSSDASIERLQKLEGVDGTTGAYGSVSGSTITITIPFGANAPNFFGKLQDADAVAITANATEALKASHFVPTSNKVKSMVLDQDAADKPTGTLVVTAQDGATRKYTVKVVTEKGFTSFALPDQTKATIDADNGKTVTVDFAYGTDLTKVTVPTYTVGDNIKKVTLAAAEHPGDPNTDIPSVVSAKTKLTAFGDPDESEDQKYMEATSTVYLWTSKTNSVEVTIVARTPAKNPEYKMTAIKVDSSNETEVTGTAVNVEMPASYDFAGADSVAVVVKMSKGATVSIPAQADVEAVEDEGHTGTATLEGVSLTGKTFVVRVASEADAKKYTDYTIKLAAASAPEAKLNDFTIKGKLDGKDVTYSADKSGVINVPYALKDNNVLKTFKVYTTVSTGAKLTVNKVEDLNYHGAEITQAMIDAGTIPTSEDAVEYNVVASNGAVVTYKISLKLANGKTARSLSAMKLVDTNKISAITEDGTFKATAKKVSDGTSTVSAFEVTVPYSYDPGDDDIVAFQTLTLSEGAKAYLVGDDSDQIVALDPDDDGAQVGDADNDKIVTIAGKALKNTIEAWDADKKELDTSAALKIVVLSELNNVGEPAADVKDWIELPANAGKFSVYYVYAVKAKAEGGYTLRSVSSPLDKNITASISGKTVTINIPASYKAADPDEAKEFSLDFTLSTQARLYIGTVAAGTAGAADKRIVADKGDEDTVGRTMFKVKEVTVGEKKSLVLIAGAIDVEDGKVTVQAEDLQVQPYTFKVTANKLETGAELTSVKAGSVTGVITKNATGGTVAISIPYGAALAPVKLTLEASKMATITVEGQAYDPTKNFDLNNKIKVVVTSEDGKTVKTYTITTTSSAQFTDVDAKGWAYNYIMKAAAEGIVKGNGDGTFSPNKSVTRRDFALMTVRMMGKEAEATAAYSGTAAFKDVADDDYAGAAIAYLLDKKIVLGYTDGTFKPMATITRQEAAKILADAMGLKGTSETKFADDSSIDNWAKPYVYACKEAGLMKGDADTNKFRPKDTINRAETATVMVNALEKK